MTDELRKIVKEMSDYIHRDVAGAFVPADQIVENALEVFSEGYSKTYLRPHAERLLREAIDAKLKIEQSWPATTDCDRFDAAFADLEGAGIVCRQHFSCCGTCAAGEIWDEIEAERAKGREIIGCAHYNCQDTESAVEGDGIYLSYGSVLRGERPSIDIGHKIAEAMRSHGLKVTWDGSLSRRIHVALDWKRRLPRGFRPAS
jgi:hypothetical protein